MNMKKLIVAVLVVLLASSCVSNKKFNSMKAEALRLEGERQQRHIDRHVVRDLQSGKPSHGPGGGLQALHGPPLPETDWTT